MSVKIRNWAWDHPGDAWGGRLRWLAAFTVVGASMLLVSACGEDEDGDEPAAAGDAIEVTANPATESPLLIGVVNVKGEPEFFEGVKAAADYLNAEAEGLLGHRVDVEECITDPTPQQGIQCANQFVRDDAVAVILGHDFTADSSFPIYERAGTAVLAPLADTNQMLVSPVARATGPGIPGALAALAGYVSDTLEGDRVVTVARPAPEAVRGFVDAPLEAAGLESSWVTFTQENPDFTSTFAAAAEQDPDLLIANIEVNSQCVPAMNALRAVGADFKVFQIICSDEAVLEAAGDLADGQLFYAPLDSIAGVDSRDSETFGHIMATYGSTGSTGYNAAVGSSSLMTLDRVLDNQGDEVTTESILKAFDRSSGVDIFMGPPLKCGEFELYPALCTVGMRIFTLEDGEKEPVTEFIEYPEYLR